MKLSDDDDCAVDIAFVPLQRREEKTLQTLQFHRAASHGHLHNDVTVTDVGGVSFRNNRGIGQTFSFSFKLPEEDKSYSFKGIKIWPEGGVEPTHSVPLPEPGKETVIYEDKSTIFRLKVEVDDGRVTKLRLFNEYTDTGVFQYAFDISEGGKGAVSQSEIDPRIRNNWEPPVEGRPGCLGGWAAFFRSRR